MTLQKTFIPSEKKTPGWWGKKLGTKLCEGIWWINYSNLHQPWDPPWLNFYQTGHDLWFELTETNHIKSYMLSYTFSEVKLRNIQSLSIYNADFFLLYFIFQPSTNFCVMRNMDWALEKVNNMIRYDMKNWRCFSKLPWWFMANALANCFQLDLFLFFSPCACMIAV